MRSNFCFKLFRRAFLTARGLRFPAHRIRLEDAQFCFRAYASAERVSILADRTCYFVYDHGGGHISQMGAEPRLHAEGIRESLTPLSSGPWGDELRREAMADFFRRVTLNRFNDSFDNRSIGFRLSWIEESRRLVEEFCLPDRLFEFYSPLNRARAWSLATGNPALVEAVSRRGNRSRAVLAHVDEVRLRKLSVESKGQRPPSLRPTTSVASHCSCARAMRSWPRSTPNFSMHRTRREAPTVPPMPFAASVRSSP